MRGCRCCLLSATSWQQTTAYACPLDFQSCDRPCLTGKVLRVRRQGINAQKTLLLVAVMAAHALGEGSGVGVSFCGHRGWAQVTRIRELASEKFLVKHFHL